MLDRYDKTDPVKILNLRNELRAAIAAGDIERIQAT